MRAQCCICADLFENSPTVNIAAAPCGHTFHEACLMRWMDTSSTCPSCRTSVKKNLIIKRLFFDAADDRNDDADDTDRLINQIGNLKALVNEKERKEAELRESRDLYQSQLAASEALCSELTTKLNQKHDQIDMLQKSLAYTQKENAAYLEEMREFHKTKKKLSELETMSNILKGCDIEIRDTIRQYSEGGESSIKTLVSMLTVLRQEYNKVLNDKKTLLAKVSTLQKKAGHYHAEAKCYKERESELKAELERTYECLTKAEKENNDKRRKLVHLRNAVRFNKTEGSQSFHRALNEDSPNVAFTPPLSVNSDSPESNATTPPPTQEAPISPDLFDDTPPPQRTRHHHHETPKLKFRKVPTAVEKLQAAKKAKIEDEDTLQIPPSFYSIMQKKLTGVSNSRAHVPSVITQGYDGFGGSTKFVQPLGPPKMNHRKLQDKKLKKIQPGGPKLLNIQRYFKDSMQDRQVTFPQRDLKDASQDEQLTFPRGTLKDAPQDEQVTFPRRTLKDAPQDEQVTFPRRTLKDAPQDEQVTFPRRTLKDAPQDEQATFQRWTLKGAAQDIQSSLPSGSSAADKQLNFGKSKKENAILHSGGFLLKKPSFSSSMREFLSSVPKLNAESEIIDLT